MNRSMLIALLAILGGRATPADAAELSGRVLDQNGDPVNGALVAISTARPREGPSTTCPSCYPDCSKRTRTGADGHFALRGLSSKLLFSLAAGGVGFQAVISEHFDPTDRPDIELQIEAISESPDRTVVSGKVLSRAGEPIVGAEVRTRTVYRTNGVIGGRERNVTPLTLTDLDGSFRITVGSNVRAVDVRAVATGYAPSDQKWERTGVGLGAQALRFNLGPGASIGGQLVYDGKPVPGVELGLVQRNRTVGNIVTPTEVSTDASGRFRFDRLPPNIDYAVYTHVGQAATAALPVSLVRAPGHGELASLGSVAASRPRRLTIQVRTESGERLPKHSHVYLSRRDAWKGTKLDLARMPIARVTVDDLAAESFKLRVRVPGYEVVRTVPPMNLDLNRAYGVEIGDDTTVRFDVRREGERESKRDAPTL